MYFNFTDKTDIWKGYGTSDIRQWLQQKPFLGTSIIWQQTVSKVQVRSLLGAEDSYKAPTGSLYTETDADGTNIYPSDYFYIPSVADMDSAKASDSFYKTETISSQNYPIFSTNEDRIKKLSTADIESGYWTRSPSNNTYSLNRGYGVIPNNMNPDSKPAGSLQTNYQSLSGGFLYFNTAAKAAEHGILIAFSI